MEELNITASSIPVFLSEGQIFIVIHTLACGTLIIFNFPRKNCGMKRPCKILRSRLNKALTTGRFRLWYLDITISLKC